jgi:hypothetical protein
MRIAQFNFKVINKKAAVVTSAKYFLKNLPVSVYLLITAQV